MSGNGAEKSGTCPCVFRAQWDYVCAIGPSGAVALLTGHREFFWCASSCPSFRDFATPVALPLERQPRLVARPETTGGRPKERDSGRVECALLTTSTAIVHRLGIASAARATPRATARATLSVSPTIAARCLTVLRRCRRQAHGNRGIGRVWCAPLSALAAIVRHLGSRLPTS